MLKSLHWELRVSMLEHPPATDPQFKLLKILSQQSPTGNNTDEPFEYVLLCFLY